LFLDIDMPQLDGFGFLNRLDDRPFEVIFTTAYNQYAINAIRSEALDFLLKPINQDELNDCLDKLIKRKSESSKSNTRSFLSKISVPSQKGLQFLSKEEIIYVSADKNYTTFYMHNQKDIVASKTLKEFEYILENIGFFRIHHSTMINLNHIVEYIKGEGGIVVMSNGAQLEVSRRRKQAFLENIL
jgi:two-component system, LytTR family, response regulator